MSTRPSNRKTPPCQPRQGFTLLELLIVLAILGVLAAIVVPNVLGTQQRANIKATETSIHGFESSLKLYAAENAGQYPSGGQDVIQTLMSTTDSEGKTVEPLLQEVPRDAWGQQLFYEYPSSKLEANKPAIWSSGPNKQDEQGGGDDVTNWVSASRR